MIFSTWQEVAVAAPAACLMGVLIGIWLNTRYGLFRKNGKHKDDSPDG